MSDPFRKWRQGFKLRLPTSDPDSYGQGGNRDVFSAMGTQAVAPPKTEKELEQGPAGADTIAELKKLNRALLQSPNERLVHKAYAEATPDVKKAMLKAPLHVQLALAKATPAVQSAIAASPPAVQAVIAKAPPAAQAAIAKAPLSDQVAIVQAPPAMQKAITQAVQAEVKASQASQPKTPKAHDHPMMALHRRG